MEAHFPCIFMSCCEKKESQQFGALLVSPEPRTETGRHICPGEAHSTVKMI